MTDKAEMLQAFNVEAYFQQCATNALSHVLAHSPVTMMIVFEVASGEIGVATVPASKAVAKALADAAYEKLWAPEILESSEEDEEGVVG